MNKVDLIGRLTKDPEVRYQTNGETGENFARARFTLAVNRKQKDNNGNYLADFIWCEAAGKLGKKKEKYLFRIKIYFLPSVLFMTNMTFLFIRTIKILSMMMIMKICLQHK